jgi:DNA-binding beta-propeller fold protein YncE
MQRRRLLAAALALVALTAAVPHRTPHKRGTFKLSVPGGPFISGSRVSVDATGITTPFSIALLGPGSVENHDFLAPQVDAATTAALIGATHDAVAYSTVQIVPAPGPKRALIAVASYDNGIAIHDASTFALLGYAPIGGAPGDVLFAPDGSLLAPATDGDALTRITRRPWKLTATPNVPLGNEVAVDPHTGNVFVTNRDAGGHGALTRVTVDGTVTRVQTGDTAEGIAIDPARGIAYVGNVNDNTVAAVDMRTMRVVRKYASVPRTFGLALDDKAQRLFVVSNMSPSMPGNGGNVETIDLRSGRAVAKSARLPFPLGVAYDAPHKRIFVTDEGSDRVYVLDAKSLRPQRKPLETCHTPWRPRITGSRLYVPCARSNQVDVFDLRSLHRAAHAPFATGGFPLSVALWP